MNTFLWVLPVLGLVYGFEASGPSLAEDTESLIAHQAATDEVQRVRRSPEPFKGSVGGGSGFKLPPGVTPFDPKPQWPGAYKRPRRSPQQGPPPFRPPPNWRPPIRPIPIAPPRPINIPRDPGRPWLRSRRSSPSKHIIRPVYIYRPTPAPPPRQI